MLEDIFVHPNTATRAVASAVQRCTALCEKAGNAAATALYSAVGRLLILPITDQSAVPWCCTALEQRWAVLSSLGARAGVSEVHDLSRQEELT